MRARPGMRDITLRPACDEDRHLILALEEDGMRRYAVALWGDWEPSATVESLILDGHEIVLSVDQPVGVVLARLKDDHLHIAKLYLAPHFRGEGIGALVLRQKLRLATRHGVPVRLRVLRTNPQAMRFYQRHGFELMRQTEDRWFLEYAASCASALE